MNGQHSKCYMLRFLIPGASQRKLHRIEEFLRRVSFAQQMVAKTEKDPGPLCSETQEFCNNWHGVFSEALRRFQTQQVESLVCDAATALHVSEAGVQPLSNIQTPNYDQCFNNHAPWDGPWYSNILISGREAGATYAEFELSMGKVDEALFSPDMSVLDSIVYCATACCILEFALVDPMDQDSVFGNSTTKLALVWALWGSKLPLPVNLSTDEIRRTMARVTQDTSLRQRISNYAPMIGFISKPLLENQKLVLPMIELLIDHLYESVAQVSKMARELEHNLTTTSRSKIARRTRRAQVAEGSCLICLEMKPNVATLCCGQPVHMNCLAMWLHNHSTCPQCRGDFPSMKDRGLIFQTVFGGDDDDSYGQDSFTGLYGFVSEF
eukprot:Nitzschia sp. Nitz4//scaffold71_size96697//44959//46101//NITZ4_004694-RA/size96697-processed-gene-0.36-mRNA-1//-1//CDS//3329557244//3000//frame0